MKNHLHRYASVIGLNDDNSLKWQNDRVLSTKKKIKQVCALLLAEMDRKREREREEKVAIKLLHQSY